MGFISPLPLYPTLTPEYGGIKYHLHLLCFAEVGNAETDFIFENFFFVCLSSYRQMIFGENGSVRAKEVILEKISKFLMVIEVSNVLAGEFFWLINCMGKGKIAFSCFCKKLDFVLVLIFFFFFYVVFF